MRSIVFSLLSLMAFAPFAHAEGPSATLFRGVDVFDGEARWEDQDVLVVGAHVMAMGSAGVLAWPEETTFVECEGCTLLPGLIDSHVHMNLAGYAPWVRTLPSQADVALDLVEAGVTSVISARSGMGERALIERIEKGRALGPHIYPAGPSVTGPGAHPLPLLDEVIPWPVSILAKSMQPTAKNARQARAEVRKVSKKYDPPFYKIYYDDFPEGSPQLSKEALDAASAEAVGLGMRVVVHAGSSQDVVDAVHAGASLIMHAPFHDGLDDSQVAFLASRGVPFVPTLRAFASGDEAAKCQWEEIEKAHVPPAAMDAYAHPPAWFLESDVHGWIVRFADYVRNGAENTKRLYDAGVPFFVGTDSGVEGVFPGAATHVEMARLAALGIPPIEILRSATSRPARFLEPAGTFGRIAPGQRADLLLVHGDPTTDIQAVDDIVGVWVSGVRAPSWGDDAP